MWKHLKDVFYYLKNTFEQTKLLLCFQIIRHTTTQNVILKHMMKENKTPTYDDSMIISGYLYWKTVLNSWQMS